MAKTKYTNKDHLEHFEKQLALRDTYVKDNADYIETKRDKIRQKNIIKVLSHLDHLYYYTILASKSKE